MNARSRLRMTALLPLGGLALAALLIGGCAAPKNEEKARFAQVSGVVVDANGNPIPGAQVTVLPSPASSSTIIGTQNFFGGVSPAVTDAHGLFNIGGVRLATTGGAPGVVLNVQATAPGFAPGVGFVQSTQVRDIRVNQPFVSGIVVRLTPAAATTIGAGGGDIPIEDGGTFHVNPDSLTGAREITAVPITVATLPAPLPGPTSGSPLPPIIPSDTQSSTRDFLLPVGGVVVQAADGGDLILSQGATATVPLNPAAAGSALAVRHFNERTLTWDTVPGTPIVNTDGTATFHVAPSPLPAQGAYILAVLSHLTVGALTGRALPLDTVEFPPILEFPNGYFSQTRLQPASFVDVTPVAQTDLAVMALRAFGIDVNPGTTPASQRFTLVQVGPPQKAETGPFAGQWVGKEATLWNFNASLIVGGQTITATGKFWKITDKGFAAPANTAEDAHLQGHAQGSAVGS